MKVWTPVQARGAGISNCLAQDRGPIVTHEYVHFHTISRGTLRGRFFGHVFHACSGVFMDAGVACLLGLVVEARSPAKLQRKPIA